MEETETYFVRRQGKIEGPWDSEKLRSEAKRKKLGKFHEVSIDKVDWVRASKLEWLFPKKTRRKQLDHDETNDSDNDNQDQGKIWYLAIDGQHEGPYTLEVARQMARDKNLGADDRAWRDGLEDWARLDEIEEFQQVLQQSGDMTGATVLVDRPISIGATTDKSTTTSKLAIASLVLSLLFCFPLPVFGMILGVVALSDVKSSQGQRTGRNLAFFGIAIGLLSLLANLILFIVAIITGALVLNA